MIGTIVLVDAAAGRAFPAGVTRIDGNQRDASQTRLIGGELAKLSEGPIVQSRSKEQVQHAKEQAAERVMRELAPRIPAPFVLEERMTQDGRAFVVLARQHTWCAE